jgi:hypothetical protein
VSPPKAGAKAPRRARVTEATTLDELRLTAKEHGIVCVQIHTLGEHDLRAEVETSRHGVHVGYGRTIAEAIESALEAQAIEGG